MEIQGLLERLLFQPGICGYEDPIRDTIQELIGSHVDRLETDALGNLIAVIEGEPGQGHIALFAHMDELGLVVTNVTADGFIRFKKMGGIDDRILPSRHVLILAQDGQKVPAVIAWMPPHLTVGEKSEDKVVPWQDMIIDAGAASSEEIHTMGIQVGDPIVFSKQISRLANGLMASRGMDNRAGCAVLVCLIQSVRELRPQSKISFVFTTQEEYGLRGAAVAGCKTEPDMAIVVDTASAPDFCGVPDVYKNQFKLGKGPLLRLVDNRMIASRAVRNFVERLAAEQEIPFQLGVVGGSTDAAAIQLASEGVAVLPICIPCRYTHATVEMVSLNDLEATVVLLQKIIQSFSV